MTHPRADDSPVHAIQVVLTSSDDTKRRVPGQDGMNLRSLGSNNVSHLVRIQGIIIRSGVLSRNN